MKKTSLAFCTAAHGEHERTGLCGGTCILKQAMRSPMKRHLAAVTIPSPPSRRLTKTIGADLPDTRKIGSQTRMASHFCSSDKDCENFIFWTKMGILRSSFSLHNEVENSYFQNKTSITDSGIVFGKATVATVSADGTVTCLAVGKTEITAKSGGGSCPCPCNISGAGYQLSVEPAGDDAQIAWSVPSLADGILSVDDSGYVTTYYRDGMTSGKSTKTLHCKIIIKESEAIQTLFVSPFYISNLYKECMTYEKYISASS